MGTSSVLIYSCLAVSRLTVCCIHVRDSFFLPRIVTASLSFLLDCVKIRAHFASASFRTIRTFSIGVFSARPRQFPELLKQVFPFTSPKWLASLLPSLTSCQYSQKKKKQVFWADSLRLKAVVSPAAASANDAYLPSLNSQSSRARVGGRSFH